MGGAIIGCIPGCTFMVINDTLGNIAQALDPDNEGITGPFGTLPFSVAVYGVIGGIFGGAAVGLYM